jgi:hypothetical protein
MRSVRHPVRDIVGVDSNPLWRPVAECFAKTFDEQKDVVVIRLLP